MKSSMPHTRKCSKNDASVQDVPEYHVYRKVRKEDLQNKHTHKTHILINQKKEMPLRDTRAFFLGCLVGLEPTTFRTTI